jgi:hypothetical protein
MTYPQAKSKDVLALRIAIICVGLSGVFLGAFVWGAGGDKPPISSALVCMAAGAVVAALGVTAWPSATLSRPRRIFGYWALVALLALELMIPLNYAGTRRHAKWDWTEGSLRSLSEKTVKILATVDRPVHVTTFFVHRDPRQAPVYNVVKDLLDQYPRHNRLVTVEHIDPSRETDKMLAVQKQLNVEDLSQLGGSIVFQCGTARKDVSSYALLQMMPGAETEEIRPETIGFRGEEEFTSALLDVTEKKRKEVHFVTGHGELSPDRELAEVASELRRDNYRVEKVENLGEGVPENCTVLVILRPNPKAPFTDREIGSVARFLGEGGKLLFGENGGGNCGLEPLFGDFGINVGRDIIIDQSSGRATYVVPVRAFGWHDLVANLRDYAMRFDVARSVEALPQPPGMMGQPSRTAVNIIMTGRNCWAETDIEGLEKGGFPAFDPKADKRGPLGVAAVHQQPDRMPNGVEFPRDMPKTKIVVVGSGDFMIGRQITIFYEPPPPANIRFFFNAVNWLAEKEALISIPPKRFDFRPMDKIETANGPLQKWFKATVYNNDIVFGVTTVAMPVFFLALGGVIWLVRRRG